MADLVEIGFKASTTGIDTANTKLDKLAKTGDKADDSLKDVAASANKADKAVDALASGTDKLNKELGETQKTSKKAKAGVAGMGRNAGMAGIQVQQFVGQIQGGQSAMLALSQQSADLGFVLGAPLLGAVAGITATVVGFIMAMGGSSIAIDNAASSIKGLISGFDKMSTVQKELAIGVVTAEIKVQSTEIKKLKDEQADYFTSLNLFTSNDEKAQKMRDYTASILENELALSNNKKALSIINQGLGLYMYLVIIIH